MVSVKQNFSEFFGNSTPQFIYEDDSCVVFDEPTNPQAPVHFLVVPKTPIPRLMDATEENEKLLGHLLLVAKKICLDNYLDNTGYHLVVDEDFKSCRLKAIHVFGRALQHMLWPVRLGARH